MNLYWCFRCNNQLSIVTRNSTAHFHCKYKHKKFRLIPGQFSYSLKYVFYQFYAVYWRSAPSVCVHVHPSNICIFITSSQHNEVIRDTGQTLRAKAETVLEDVVHRLGDIMEWK